MSQYSWGVISRAYWMVKGTLNAIEPSATKTSIAFDTSPDHRSSQVWPSGPTSTPAMSMPTKKTIAAMSSCFGRAPTTIPTTNSSTAIPSAAPMASS